jgi:hypothetical protein
VTTTTLTAIGFSSAAAHVIANEVMIERDAIRGIQVS